MSKPTTILSFDVEEHYRIEAAAGLPCADVLKQEYGRRVDSTVQTLARLLAEAKCRATFFILGELAAGSPRMVRELHEAGHEIGSHGWNHEPVHRLNPTSFREDLTKSKDALERAIGAPVHGYRAPTFSIMKKTAWAVDVLRECGYTYDSSIFPVLHDRYGVPDAPTVPFWCHGPGGGDPLLELPPLTLRGPLVNLPIGGGGYFRLFPLAVLKAGIWLNRKRSPSVSMLYFHPWEFDPGQPRLALPRLRRWRTYVGIGRTERRLQRLLRATHLTTFRRAIDVAEALRGADLPHYHLGGPALEPAASAAA